MPLLDELASFMATAGLGSVGASIFKGTLPDVAGTAIGLVEYGGAPPLRRAGGDNQGTLAELPRVQALVRSTDYQTARATAQAVVAACDWLGPRTLTASSGGSGTAYAAIEVLQRPPLFLGYDANDRVRFAVNIQATRAPVP